MWTDFRGSGQAQVEIDTLKKQLNAGGFTPDSVENLRLELKNLQNRNMGEASFEERLDLVARLGIKVYPSEDLKSRRIKCGVDLRELPNDPCAVLNPMQETFTRKKAITKVMPKCSST